MEYYHIVFRETTTDGREYIYISTGEGTADIECITVGGLFNDSNDNEE